jgi:hypothetical protein
MKNSPAGKTVQLVHEKRPELSAEECLTYARVVLERAAGRKRYEIIVLSAEDEVKEQTRREKLRGGRPQKLSSDVRQGSESRKTTIPEAAGN